MWAAAFVLLLVAAESACLYLAYRWLIRESKDDSVYRRQVVFEALNDGCLTAVYGAYPEDFKRWCD